MVKTETAILLAAVVVLAAAAEATGTETLPPDGPYPVGVRIEHIDHDTYKMPVMVWYPARVDDGAKPYKYPTKIQGSAVFNAEADRRDAPYALVLFSHGLAGCGCQSVFYTENLASHGYVVVAPDYKDAAMCKIEGEPTLGISKMIWTSFKSLGNLQKAANALYHKYLQEEVGLDFSYRALDAKKVIDEVLIWNQESSSFLHGMINTEQIGATGHSLGGYTSLMIGGMPFLCGNEQMTESCDPEMNILERDPCCNESIRRMKTPFELRDRRVKAVLPLGPSVIFPNLEEGATEIEIPIMIITGGQKRMEAPWEPIWTLYDHAPAPKYLVRLRKTDHMTISDMGVLLSNPIARLSFPGFRFHYRDKAQAYKDYSVGFFDVFLKGEDKTAAVLKKPSNPWVELWSETE
jgi:predicted dienelactone hydrolase